MWTLMMLALCSSIREELRPSQCQGLCSENEIFVNSVNPCNTCENRKECALDTVGVSGCDCLAGFYKNNKGKCVPEEECDGNKILCKKDEVFLGCSCERTCCNGGRAVGCEASCKKGCFCKQGLVRHEDGRCIRLKDCEKENGENSPGPGSQPVRCSIPNCADGCSIDYSTKPCPSCSCPDYTTVQCGIPKCDDDCNIDYSTKPCPSCSCPDYPTVQCDIPKCDDDCTIDYSTKPCPSCSCPDSPQVQCSIPKCDAGCSLDYSSKPCPSCSCPALPSPTNCKPDEQYYECIPICHGTCSAYLTKSYLYCKMACRSGCFCREGLYKTDDGRCVPASQCTAPNSPENTCGENAEYRECGSACPPTCADSGRKNKICTKQCVSGCFCKKGFVKNDQGVCVRPQECQKGPPPVQCSPPKCAPGCSIDYSTKPCPSCSCTGYPPIQCSPPKCAPGCSIDYSSQPCPSCSCPNTCGANAEYRECGSACPPTCADRGKNRICTLQCVSGCFCKKGFVKNNRGVCVKPQECDQIGTTCSGLQVTDGSATCFKDGDETVCQVECDGEDQGEYTCTKDKGWTPDLPTCAKSIEEKCPTNEVYSDCVIPCNDCQIRGKCNFLVCNKGCDCRKGYYRDFSGRCIPARQCPIIDPTPPASTCEANKQYYECIPSCDRTCKAYRRKEKILCNQICISGCFCREGLYLSDDGKTCVPPEQCDKTASSPTKICPKNEVYSDCVIPCNDCQIRGKCNFLVCNKGCDCRKGYYRDFSGRCIPARQCPIIDQKCPKNEVYSDCVIPCNDCQIRGKCNFLVCNKGCDCRKGYYRDFSGRCIPARQCPIIDPTPAPAEQCSPDQQYYECIPRCSRTCEAYTRPVEIFCNQLCVKGCFCREGLYEAEDGSCVPPEQCPVPTTSLAVGTTCSGLQVTDGSATCFKDGDETVCQVECDGEDQGEYTCTEDKGWTPELPTCAKSTEGYNDHPIVTFRDSNKSGEEELDDLILALLEQLSPSGDTYSSVDIILQLEIDFPNKGIFGNPAWFNIFAQEAEQCPENEEYSDCVNPCNDCQTRGNCNFLVCNKGCDCKEGYYRDFDGGDGRCILGLQCPMIDPTPPPNQCGADEQFYDCIPACQQTCFALTSETKIACKMPCRSGCYCKEGLYQKDDGTCVPPEGCYDDDDTPVTATLLAATPPPNQCGADEQFYDCIPACQQTCFALTSEVKIACRMPCRSGCYCREGLYQKDDGTCVPPEGCYDDDDTPVTATSPAVTPTQTPSCGKNEQYYPCIPTCKNTCENYQAVNPICPRICIAGCSCKKGFVRRSDGKCVKPEKCNKSSPTIKPTKPMNQQCGRPNEQYYRCIPTCKNTCENYQAVRPCPFICIAGCSCKKGYVKRSDGKCVKPEKCQSPPSTKPTTTPTPSCRKNEEYYSCKPTCRNTCENYQAVRPICPRICIKGCACKKGFVRRSDGKCVKPEKCNKSSPTIKPTKPMNQQCGPEEQYYSCIPTCKNTCENYQAKRPICPRICRRGCFCKKGLVKRSDGKCVKPDKCNSSAPEPTAPLPTSNPTCLLEKEVGPCRAALTRYFYNYKLGQCEKFKYGGCRGNKNNFKNIEDCQVICGGETSPPKCGKDEQYYKCVPYCNETCDNYNLVLPCPYYCKPGCFCKKGLVKNRDGKCVKTSECPSTNPPSTGSPPIQCSIPKCGTGCSIDYSSKPCPSCSCTSVPPPTNSVCMQPKDSGPCLAIFPRWFYNQQTGQCEEFTYGGCPGNKNNFKTKNDCERTCGNGPTPSPPKCGKDEEYYSCVPNCHNTCDTYNQKGPCPLYCKSGCFCKKGMVKNKKGKCVKPSKCPSSNPPSAAPPPASNPVCQQAKEVGPCKARIPRFFYNQETRQCEQFDYGGCRGNKNNFETNEECESKCGSATPTPTPTPACGSDEQYYPCIPNCHNTCATYNKTNVACPDSCGPGCFCKEGLVKNDDGTCVSPSQCNPLQPTDGSEECGEGEEYYDDCAPKCTGTCEAYNNPGIYNCPLCKPGCWCSQGLVKKSDGQCVPPDQCNVPSSTEPPDQCGEDEEYYEDCAPSCGGTCETYKKLPILNCRNCRPGCWCSKGLVKRKDGKCVPKDQCNAPTDVTPTPAVPPDSCREDEEYLSCGSACPPTCTTLRRTDFACIALCVPGCFCRKGLIRNDQGDCVKPEDCPQKTCGEDEEYSDCGSACPPTCSNRGKEQMCTMQCVSGCFCREELVRNEQGECVKPENCPQKTCNEDEEYKECGSSCPPTCSTRGKKQICTKECVPGCFCREGLVKNDQGECVEPEDCPQDEDPQKCGEDEEYTDCGSACPPTCSNIGKDQVCTDQCVPGCFCREGLVRNDKGECVEPEECPRRVPEECGEDEKYYDCAPSCGGTCDTYNMTAVILCLPCGPGCWCNEGLVKNNEGKCVPPEQCDVPKGPNKLCGVNEIYYDECAPSCKGTCATHDQAVLCPECTPGCWCKKGYLKNQYGKCVPKRKCNIKRKIPHCPKDQQYYDCIPSCKRTCMTYNSTSAYCPKECIMGCFCKDGLVMNKNGECVPPEECPVTCPLNQKYYECMPDCQNRCNPPDACAAVCKSGCFCKEGLVMREDGKCVRQELCEEENPGQQKCGPDQEYYDCYQRCRNSCATRNGVCPAVCESGCFCKKGLLLDSQGKCVEPDECDDDSNSVEDGSDGSPGSDETSEPDNEPGNKRKCSGVNEEVVPCAKPCNTCLIRGNCKLKRCIKGCDCKSGYYRDDSGTCIPQDQCPGASHPGECSGENEEVVPCAKPKWCNTCGIRGNCKLKECEAGCDCKSGYYRDDSGVCIPEDQCPAATPPGECSGENEEVVPCAKPKWCNTCGIRGNCKLKECEAGCDCKSGYYRDDSGVCIPEDQCPAATPQSPRIRCSMPKCDDDCSIDYSTKPCPSCSCTESPRIRCSMPKCDDDCSIDYSTKPCPSCSCTETPRIRCSMPKCDDDCRIDYSTKPCPSCSCPDSPTIQCSIPKCDDDGCSIDYSTKPCPSCSCTDSPTIQCSIPKCDDDGCSIDYFTKPCPSCSCTEDSNTNPGNTLGTDNENDSSNGSSYSEGSFSSTSEAEISESGSMSQSSNARKRSSRSQSDSGNEIDSEKTSDSQFSESDSMSQSADFRKRSSRFQSGSGRWFSDNSSGNEIDSEKNSSEESGEGYPSMSSGATEWSSGMSSDSENSSSRSSSGSRTLSSNTSSRTDGSSAENEIDSADESAVTEDIPSSDSESGYSTMSSSSENWSADMSDDSKRSASKSSSGSRKWSSNASNSKNSPSGDETDSEDASSSEEGSGYSRSSSGSTDWSSVVAADSENSSSKSQSGSRTRSSKMSSYFDNDEEEEEYYEEDFNEEDEDNENESEEYSFSWTEDGNNDGN